jgi:hypothetical protein
VRGLLVALATACSAASLAAPGQSATRCTPGPTRINDQTARVYCGPATAVVHVGGVSFHFTQGSCTTGNGTFAVNIGIQMIPPSGQLPAFAVFQQEGRAAITYRTATAHDSLLNATLVRRGKAGTFSGVGLVTHRRVTGSYSCS